MALKPLYSNVITPYGEYDALDSERTSYKGGEVVTFTYLDLTSTDKAASDVLDGYVSNTTKKRLAVTRTLTSGDRPLFLADEGIAGYGTMFGQVVGGVVGQVNVNGTVLGPHTTEGSGKITLWNQSGIYAITLDAVDTDENTGLQPTNQTLAGKDALYATANGVLTPNVAEAFEPGAVARFLEFQSKGSLVSTPKSIVAAVNSNIPKKNGNGFTQVHIYFDPD